MTYYQAFTEKKKQQFSLYNFLFMFLVRITIEMTLEMFTLHLTKSSFVEETT